jgi:hypothetical protein
MQLKKLLIEKQMHACYALFKFQIRTTFTNSYLNYSLERIFSLSYFWVSLHKYIKQLAFVF